MTLKEEDKKELLNQLYKIWENESNFKYVKLTRVPNNIPSGFINNEMFGQNFVTDELLRNLSDDKLIRIRKTGNDIEVRLTKDGVIFVLFMRTSYTTKSTNSFLSYITFVMACITAFALMLSILSYYIYINQFKTSLIQLGISAIQLGHSLNNTGLINASSQLLASSLKISPLNTIAVWAAIVIIILFLGIMSYKFYNMDK